MANLLPMDKAADLLAVKATQLGRRASVLAQLVRKNPRDKRTDELLKTYKKRVAESYAAVSAAQWELEQWLKG